MLDALPTYITSVLAENQDLLPRSPQSASYIRREQVQPNKCLQPLAAGGIMSRRG